MILMSSIHPFDSDDWIISPISASLQSVECIIMFYPHPKLPSCHRATAHDPGPFEPGEGVFAGRSGDAPRLPRGSLAGAFPHGAEAGLVDVG